LVLFQEANQNPKNVSHKVGMQYIADLAGQTAVLKNPKYWF